jgi:hypothetical protein
VNELQKWIRASRREEAAAPKRYLRHYVDDVLCDDHRVYMTQPTLSKMLHHCGNYDWGVPTGVYCGKIFLQGNYLKWFGISKDDPMHKYTIHTREIVICDKITRTRPGLGVASFDKVSTRNGARIHE